MLLRIIFTISGVALVSLYFAQAFWPILVLFAVYSLAFAATTSLQDGLNFLVQQQRIADGATTSPYHKTRVWGTVGFILPSLFLFELFRRGYPDRIGDGCGGCFLCDWVA